MKNPIYSFGVIAILLTAICLHPTFSFAQPGSLDLTFGVEGKVTTGLVGEFGSARAAAIQSDGKIILAGNSLIRYNIDGTLDTTFGTGGNVTTDFGGGYSVAIQPDEKILLAGMIDNAGDYDFALTRFNSDGTLDDTFGSGGLVTKDFGSIIDVCYSITLQPDGKIVMAGYTGIFPYEDFALARYNGDGTLDNTFSYDGVVTTAIGLLSDVARSVAMQSDGKIVVTGGFTSFALVRYNSDGTLDDTFGTDGVVTSGIEIGYSVAIQPDGKIIVSGQSYIDFNRDFAVARYNINGTLDTSFGSDGIVTTDFGGSNDYSYSVQLEPDGKIVVSGVTPMGFYLDFGLVRYNSDGTLDNTFGTGGKVTTDFGGNNDVGYAVVIQTDKKIVVAGQSYIFGLSSEYALARYHGGCDTIDTYVLQTENILTANATDVIYQWIDCDNANIPISGATNQSYTATTNGNYAVIITDNFCSDTSACYNVEIVSIEENIYGRNIITLSPNPFINELIISMHFQQSNLYSGEIILFDVMGKEIMRQKIVYSETKINTQNLLPGFYLLHYSDGKNTENFKVIKF